MMIKSKINSFINDFNKYAPKTYKDWHNKTRGNIQQITAFETYFQTYNAICNSLRQASIEKFFVNIEKEYNKTNPSSKNSSILTPEALTGLDEDRYSPTTDGIWEDNDPNSSDLSFLASSPTDLVQLPSVKELSKKRSR